MLGKLGLKFPTWENISLPVDKAGKLSLENMGNYGKFWENIDFPNGFVLGNFG